MHQPFPHMRSVGLLSGMILMLAGCTPAARSKSADATGTGQPMPASMPRDMVGPTATPVESGAAAAPVQRIDAAPLGLYGQMPFESPTGAQQSNGLENLRQVTFASEGEDFDPAVDPTGKVIVFASTRHRSTPDLYLQQVTGTAVTRLTDDTSWNTMPTFSPDGKRIAFCSNRSGNMDIYLMSLDGGQPVQMTSDPAHDIHPSFSPDGKNLVYSTQSLTTGQWEMVVIDVENPGQKHYIGSGLFPEWSPKGDKIVFQRARQRGTRWFSLWTVDYVSGEGRRPTELAASANAACLTPCWSPDGAQIVFCTVISDQANPGQAKVERPSQADIWVMNADGSSRVNLTRNTTINTQPTWSSDGGIYFVSATSRFSPQNIWSVRPDRALSALRSGATATVHSSTPVMEKPVPAAAQGVSHGAGHAGAAPGVFVAPAAPPVVAVPTPAGTEASPAHQAVPAAINIREYEPPAMETAIPAATPAEDAHDATTPHTPTPPAPNSSPSSHAPAPAQGH